MVVPPAARRPYFPLSESEVGPELLSYAAELALGHRPHGGDGLRLAICERGILLAAEDKPNPPWLPWRAGDLALITLIFGAWTVIEASHPSCCRPLWFLRQSEDLNVAEARVETLSNWAVPVSGLRPIERSFFKAAVGKVLGRPPINGDVVFLTTGAGTWQLRSRQRLRGGGREAKYEDILRLAPPVLLARHPPKYGGEGTAAVPIQFQDGSWVIRMEGVSGSYKGVLCLALINAGWEIHPDTSEFVNPASRSRDPVMERVERSAREELDDCQSVALRKRHPVVRHLNRPEWSPDPV